LTVGRTARPGSAVAPPLALEGAPDAGVRIGEARWRQAVSSRAICGRVRGHAVSRSVVQGEARQASMSRKKRCHAGAMSVNSTHADYDASLPAWLRARDVIAGEDAVKAAGERFLARLEAQTDEENLVLCWAHWWNPTEAMPGDVNNEQVVIELNTDYSTRGLSANEIVAMVRAWQSGAQSQDLMVALLRCGEVLAEGRTDMEERALVIAETICPPKPKDLEW
jgi:hypothetical protein